MPLFDWTAPETPLWIAADAEFARVLDDRDGERRFDDRFAVGFVLTYRPREPGADDPPREESTRRTRCRRLAALDPSRDALEARRRIERSRVLACEVGP